MEETLLRWLLEEDNHAVRYRTQTQLLEEPGDAEAARAWILRKLPARWQETRGHII